MKGITMKFRSLLCITIAALGAVFSLQGNAHEYTLGSIRIVHPWARATVPGAQTGGAYLKLENSGADDKLVSVNGNVSAGSELHTTSMNGNVMTMQKLDKGLAVPAGKTVELKPGGTHIMLVELKAPLKEGTTFPLKLRFEKAGEITVDVKVSGLGASTPGDEHMH